MDKINWRRKLSSRKFWALLAALVASGTAFFWPDTGGPRDIAGLIAAAGACSVYILAEGAVDREYAKGGDCDES